MSEQITGSSGRRIPPRTNTTETGETAKSQGGAKTGKLGAPSPPSITRINSKTGSSTTPIDTPEKTPNIPEPSTTQTPKEARTNILAFEIKTSQPLTPEQAKKNLAITPEEREKLSNIIKNHAEKLTAILNDKSTSSDYKQAKVSTLIYELFGELAKGSLEFSKYLAGEEHKQAEAIRKEQEAAAAKQAEAAKASNASDIFGWVSSIVNVVAACVAVAVAGGLSVLTAGGATPAAVGSCLYLSAALTGMTAQIANATGVTAKCPELGTFLMVTEITFTVLSLGSGAVGASKKLAGEGVVVAANATAAQVATAAKDAAELLVMKVRNIVQVTSAVTQAGTGIAEQLIALEIAGLHKELADINISMTELDKSLEAIKFFNDQSQKKARLATETASDVMSIESTSLQSSITTRSKFSA